MNKTKKYLITLTEDQLMLIAQCVEDCHRFAAGQTELYNVLRSIDMEDYSLRKKLQKLQSLVTPGLGCGASYDWIGSGCPNEAQRKFIAQSYYLYREIYHQRNLIEGIDNVYTSETLRCADSGEPIKIKVINKETEETI
nr:MAG TPA: hypothetical protein [Caudoviricetes sp.]